MKKVKVVYEVYRFKELNREAKDKAIANWYEKEDYPFLEEQLTESCKALLEAAKIKGDPALGYSLSYSQGDGLNFTGEFEWRKYRITVTHSWRYPFASASEITLSNEEGGEIISESAKILPKFNASKESKLFNRFAKIYLGICFKLEREGYATLEYRMNDKEFAEHCQANNYNFFKDGRMINL
ncbi:MAG: hypothetical protein WC476_12075 [Phycisphaerae bacterium]|jgi:hypothetical protein